jgi:hypothetical protein
MIIKTTNDKCWLLIDDRNGIDDPTEIHEYNVSHDMKEGDDEIFTEIQIKWFHHDDDKRYDKPE